MRSNKFLDQLEHLPFLIMSHRGFWGGNVIENSIESTQLAFKAGADIVEVDVCQTSDGEYYLFHDGNEPNVLRKTENFRLLSSEEIDGADVYNSIGTPSGKKIIKLSDYLKWLPDDYLINIDRSWPYWKEESFFKLIRESGKEDQLFFKSPVASKYLDSFSKNGKGLNYVPILKTREEFEVVRSYPKLQMIGVELVVRDLNDSLLDEDWLHELRDKNLFTVANVENLGEDFNLFGGIDDDTILFGEHTWADVISQRMDVIQTDWPNFAVAYRKQIKVEGDLSQ